MVKRMPLDVLEESLSLPPSLNVRGSWPFGVEVVALPLLLRRQGGTLDGGGEELMLPP